MPTSKGAPARPWHHHSMEMATLCASDGTAIVYTKGDSVTMEQAEDNAALIVAAVNSHDTAMRLCEKILRPPGTDHVDTNEKRMSLDEWYEIQDLAEQFMREAGDGCVSNVNYMIVTCVPHGAIVCAKCFPPPTITATECPTCVEVRKTVAEQAARLAEWMRPQTIREDLLRAEAHLAKKKVAELERQLAERDKVVAAQAKLLNTTVGQRVADEVAAERERCARLAGSYPPISGLLYGKDIAAAIRQTASAPPADYGDRDQRRESAQETVQDSGKTASPHQDVIGTRYWHGGKCCGCWLIIYDANGLYAKCNECGETKSLDNILAPAPPVVDVAGEEGGR